ncbi:hypothetical protein TpMuguga_02g00432 [Theileria parva strain Muguga]|uniref:uncharacterized protein n=1 Tax=Theileria parva strain Muguga TaxID=333668 RepID=UPI001C624243|nr:uncharacterized protein TpMuguga_02g00432 [Theileria parva strain Muguga]EAN32715.2 hypothetical protein TpMuguga_02g00432 [Theileria parva strain Muguga]
MEDNFGAFYTPVLKGYDSSYETYLPQSMLNELPWTGFHNDPAMLTDNVSTSGFFPTGNSNLSRQTTLKQAFSPQLSGQQSSFVPLFPQNSYSKGVNLFKRTNSFQFRRNSNSHARSRSLKRSFSSSTSKSNQSMGSYNPNLNTLNHYNHLNQFNNVNHLNSNNFNNVNHVNSNQFNNLNSVNNLKGMGSNQFSNVSTNVSRVNSVNEMGRNGVNDSVRNSFKLRPRKCKRNPNVEKGSPFNRAFNRVVSNGFDSINTNFGTTITIVKDKFDVNDAVRFLEGLVMFVLGVFRTIFGELRSDVISGMLGAEETSDYDVARSNYYSQLDEKFKNSGLTQRIDYTEAIENEYKRRRTVTDLRVDEVPEYVNPHNTDFMNMTEQEFEEFLLKQAFPNTPLSVPRI